MAKRYAVGVIGTGYWGPHIARSFELTGRATIRWLCDRDAERARMVAAGYPGARTAQDPEELFADSALDAVAISTPATTHFALTRRALEAGKHVLVEKPFTASSAEARALLRMHQETTATLMVGHVFEYNATARALKDIVESGELGTIYYLHFERTNLGPVRTDVNALWDLATHDVSIMCYLLGRAPRTVTCHGRSFLNPGVEDAVFSTFTFDGGTMAHVHASWLNPRKIRQITVVGSKKMAVWDDLDLRYPVQIYDKHIADPADVPDTFVAYKTQVVDGGAFSPSVSLNQPLRAECDHFLDCIEHGRRPQSDGYSGLRVVLAAEAAVASMRHASAVTPVEAVEAMAAVATVATVDS
jgi:predicted dehydrogenase